MSILNRNKKNKIEKKFFANNIPTFSSQQEEFIRKTKRHKQKILFTQVLILVSFFTLWEALTYLSILDAFIVSSPSRVLNTVIKLYSEGVLFHHILITTIETFIGFILGTLIGTIIAILLWVSDFVSKVVEPYLVVLNSLPKIALGPIFIVWIGAGPAAIIAVALTISVIVTVLETFNGFKEVDINKVELIKVLGGNKIMILKKVVLPASLPTIINALKVNVGLSWVGVIVGEFLVSKAGLGYLIVYGGQVFKLDLVMTSILILAIIAALMYLAVIRLQNIIQNSKKYT